LKQHFIQAAMPEPMFHWENELELLTTKTWRYPSSAAGQ